MSNIVLCDSTNNSLFICNIKNSYLSSVSLDENSKCYKNNNFTNTNDFLYVANYSSGIISIIDKSTFRCINSFYGGANPKDLLLLYNYIFVVCGGSNTVDVFDKNTLTLLVTIPVRDFPCNIQFNSKKNQVLVTSFLGSSISVIDVDNLLEVDVIESVDYPTKIIVSQKHNILISCESCLADEKGYLEFFSLEDYSSILRIPLGKSPVDICLEDDYVYVTSLDDGTVSIFDLNKLDIDSKIYIGGALSCICKCGKYLSVVDKESLSLIIVDLERCVKRKIALGEEPNAINVLI